MSDVLASFSIQEHPKQVYSVTALWFTLLQQPLGEVF
jgi:hypothetical protein